MELLNCMKARGLGNGIARGASETSAILALTG